MSPLLPSLLIGLAPFGADELTSPAATSEALAALAAAHPERASVVPYGTSRGGRPLEALQLSAGEGRPTILLVGNVEGPRVFDGDLVLHHARLLLEDERGAALLERANVLAIPVPNPDVAARRFVSPASDAATQGHGRDDDRDGRQGEDPPADVDGDGRITQLRVLDIIEIAHHIAQ